jgi:Ankyrin repeats (3 copies)
MQFNKLHLFYLLCLPVCFSLSMEHNKEFLHAMENCDLASVQDYIANHKDGVNTKTALLGITLLHTAAREGKAEVVKLLLGKRANIQAERHYDRKPIQYNGHQALHSAAAFNHANVIKILLNNGAQVNAKSHTGTPLKLAEKNESTQAIALLTEYIRLEQEIMLNCTPNTLIKTIKQDFSKLMSLAFYKLGIKPTKEHLALAKENNSIECGHLLLDYLKTTNAQPTIAQTGITYVDTLELPQEITELIASYTL